VGEAIYVGIGLAALHPSMLLRTGLAISSDAQVDAELLLQEADVPLYRAKASGRGCIEVLDAASRDELTARTIHQLAVWDKRPGSARLNLGVTETVLMDKPAARVYQPELRGLGVLVAEGAETEEQLATFRSLGCELAQGFLLTRPMDAATADRRQAARSSHAGLVMN
jgi:predicted signal transduction protein with EAL and GGDEF domain